MEDAFERILELYSKGDLSALVRSLLPKPDSSYDDLKSSNPIFPYFVNYLDACLYGTYYDVLHSAATIKHEILSKPGNYTFTILKRLELEFDFVQAALTNKPQPQLPPYLKELLKGTGDPITETLPPAFVSWAESTNRFQKNLCRLKNANHFFNSLIASLPPPFYPLNRELLIDSKIAFDGSPALWIFNDLNHLQQSLQFADMLEAVICPQSRVYILDAYPHRQLLDQDPFDELPKRFVSPHPLLQASIPLLGQALDAVRAQSKDSMSSDTEVADWLYHASNRTLFIMREQQLGRERIPALIESMNIKRWYDPHKGVPDQKRDLGPVPFDYFQSTLDELSTKRPPFKRRIRLTHVTPQIVDDKHAPSRLLESLIKHHNRDQFNVNIIVTERLVHRTKDYPIPTHSAKSSMDWGKEHIQKFEESGVRVTVIDPIQSFLETAQSVSKELSNNDTEIVVFHSPDVINCMATVLSPCRLRVMFEHGTPLSYPGFDLMIASSMEAPKLYGEKFASFNTRIVPLPFKIDVTKTWPIDPPQLSTLGIPEWGLVMTTISNHLGSRLGNQMSLTIAQILKRVPHAFYAPMGPVQEKRKAELMQFFKEQGVANRVLFLGPQSNPGHIARCMKLYLNEFPFGSCIGMLEAMASGCVPISMYDAAGPSQARYGGDFMGIDHVITSNHIDDYIDLACQLLENPDLYKEWSDHTKAQYKKFANEKDYVNNFENLLINNIDIK